MKKSNDLHMFLRTRFASLLPAYRCVRRWASEYRSTQSVFCKIYRHRKWDDMESLSGPGSNLSQTVGLRAELPRILDKLSASSLLDAPCGHCMRRFGQEDTRCFIATMTS